MADPKPWWTALGEGDTWTDDSTGTNYVKQGGVPVVVGTPQAEKSLAPIPGNDQDTLKKMGTASDAAQVLANATNDFVTRNAQTPTGGLLAIPGATAVAKALPGVARWAGIQHPENLSAMDRDAVTSATALKPSGIRMTQMEFQKFLGSGIGMGAARETNMPLQTPTNNANTMAQAQTAFYRAYADRNRTLAGALPAWMNFQVQHFDTKGNYYHDPTTNPERGMAGGRPAVNSALQAQSTQGRAMRPPPAALPMVDINGRPVGQ